MFQRHITLVSFHLNLVENFKNIFDLAQFFLRFTVVLFSATPDFGADSNSSDVVPIIAGVLGAIFGVFLLGLLYFCFVRKRKRDSKLQHCSNTHYPPPPSLPLLQSGARFILILISSHTYHPLKWQNGAFCLA